MTATDPLSLIMTAWAASALLMGALWLLERRLRNLSIADVGWCYGLALVLLWYAGLVSGEPARRLLVCVMVVVYAVRLGTHVLFDRLWGKSEDGRYRALRLQWGEQGSLRRFWYFQLQAAAIAWFSLPPLVVMQNPFPPFHLVELLGLLLWIVAVTGRRCPIGSWRPSAVNLGTRTACAGKDCGTTRATPITFLNGCTGGVTWSWEWRVRWATGV